VFKSGCASNHTTPRPHRAGTARPRWARPRTAVAADGPARDLRCLQRGKLRGPVLDQLRPIGYPSTTGKSPTDTGTTLGRTSATSQRLGKGQAGVLKEPRPLHDRALPLRQQHEICMARPSHVPSTRSRSPPSTCCTARSRAGARGRPWMPDRGLHLHRPRCREPFAPASLRRLGHRERDHTGERGRDVVGVALLRLLGDRQVRGRSTCSRTGIGRSWRSKWP